MTDKELRKLSRAELIDILFELQTQNENLTAENRELAAQLESRQLQITEAGSIAEAALRLNGVFEAAQAAADQYVRCTKDSLTIAERTLAAVDMDIEIAELIIIGGVGVLDQRYAGVGDNVVGLIPGHAINAAPSIAVALSGVRPPSSVGRELRPRAVVDLVPDASIRTRSNSLIRNSGIVLADGIIIQRTGQIVPCTGGVASLVAKDLDRASFGVAVERIAVHNEVNAILVGRKVVDRGSKIHLDIAAGRAEGNAGAFITAGRELARCSTPAGATRELTDRQITFDSLHNARRSCAVLCRAGDRVGANSAHGRFRDVDCDRLCRAANRNDITIVTGVGHAE